MAAITKNVSFKSSVADQNHNERYKELKLILTNVQDAITTGNVMMSAIVKNVEHCLLRGLLTAIWFD
ncbi:hypothetical protein [Escherichia coli]|uniref:hypothetical protein n=1 Tax=Escherichia coli TaxID=562 RepID=UPI0012FF8E42|nr:hypothetical protein [Escherichia coli]EGK3837681.1 hypothetical protein [Escherichia coli]EHW3014085.1 hypothetical protein [Escherichia coli]EHW5237507.1 hypothetical protein [Escherichia coli]EHW6033800.1 hypothetical protein [Escherichia coli]EHX0877786.1 hypothetical protein [Escherichia coli]